MHNNVHVSLLIAFTVWLQFLTVSWMNHFIFNRSQCIVLLFISFDLLCALLTFLLSITEKIAQAMTPIFYKDLNFFSGDAVRHVMSTFFFIINSITLYIRKYLKRKRLVKYFFSHALHVNKFCWNVDGICKKNTGRWQNTAE